MVAYVHRQLGLPIASTAPLARTTEAFDKAVHRFARDHGLPWVDFAKGQRKDDIAHEHLARFTGTEGGRGSAACGCRSFPHGSWLRPRRFSVRAPTRSTGTSVHTRPTPHA